MQRYSIERLSSNQGGCLKGVAQEGSQEQMDRMKNEEQLNGTQDSIYNSLIDSCCPSDMGAVIW
jgi:hypothetical protein